MNGEKFGHRRLTDGILRCRHVPSLNRSTHIISKYIHLKLQNIVYRVAVNYQTAGWFAKNKLTDPFSYRLLFNVSATFVHQRAP